jgi:hypothetical protein
MGAQIYKFIKIFVYFNLWWSWVNDDLWHTHALRFLQYNNWWWFIIYSINF